MLAASQPRLVGGQRWLYRFILKKNTIQAITGQTVHRPLRKTQTPLVTPRVLTGQTPAELTLGSRDGGQVHQATQFNRSCVGFQTHWSLGCWSEPWNGPPQCQQAAIYLPSLK